MLYKFSLLFVLLALLLCSCSVYKRHYTKGLYIESSAPAGKSKNISICTFQEKLHSHFATERLPVTVINQNKKEVGNSLCLKQKETIALVQKTKQFSVLPVKKIKKTVSKPHDVPDEHLNHVAKAGLRLSIISLLFLMGGMYIFFQPWALFYIVFAVFVISFIFALVSVMTSISAHKDKIATDQKGRWYAIFAILLSSLIVVAMAWFLIFTPQ